MERRYIMQRERAIMRYVGMMLRILIRVYLAYRKITKNFNILKLDSSIITSVFFRLLTNAPGSEDLVNDLSWDDCTALYYTVLGGHVDIVKLLLQRGGKNTILSTDHEGMSPLHNSVLANSV